MANRKIEHYAAGMRLGIRDQEWLVKGVRHVHVSNNSKLDDIELTCLGVSNLVSGRIAKFLVSYENALPSLKGKAKGKAITIYDPKTTLLVDDKSPNFRQSRVFIESALRRTPATDDKIHIANDAALDVMGFQLKPTKLALDALRPRILIADAVGIGKTLEAGILVSELIARQRGKRILVVAVKAMLDQFRKEFWNRFSIPLTSLDSEGIQRIQRNIPAGQNPFLHIDRAIISVDTLKQDIQYRNYLEKAHWDIIIIDEAHNVADRGTKSQRAKLAKLLARQSDALIMLSATPHDGRPESFASLIDMLDPTVLSDHKHYTRDDIPKSLFIRRFKNDPQVLEQAKGAFPQREVKTIRIDHLTPAEEAVYAAIQALDFRYIDSTRKDKKPDAGGNFGSMLFKTSLQKALYSSPAACLEMTQNRLKKLYARRSEKTLDSVKAACLDQDVSALEEIKNMLEAIPETGFAKFEKLVSLLKGDADNFGWDKKAADDRLVIFTESLKTLEFLEKNLPKAIGLKPAAVTVLRGSDSDRNLMDKVEQFNRRDSDIRLMLATDVASEGLNLHPLCHRLIHFELPWALLTYQQRNGRIDRYGQDKQPVICYLATESMTARQAADAVAAHQKEDDKDERFRTKVDSPDFASNVLLKLVEKDTNAQTNINDPSEFFGTVEEQEGRTAHAIETGVMPEDEAPENDDFDPFKDLFGDEGEAPEAESPAGLTGAAEDAAKGGRVEDEAEVAPRKLLFKSDYEFLKAGIAVRQWMGKHLEEAGNVSAVADIQTKVELDDVTHTLTLNPPKDLEVRLKYLPREVLPENRQFVLTSDRHAVMDAIKHAGENPNSSWPAKQLLWELHPVVQWMEDWSLGAFGRHAAPLVPLSHLPDGELWFLIQGGYPNKKGQTLVHDWFAVRANWQGHVEVRSRSELMNMLPQADRAWINPAEELDKSAAMMLMPLAVDAAAQELKAKRIAFEAVIAPKKLAKEQDLARLLAKQTDVLEEQKRKIEGQVDVAKRQERALEALEQRRADIEAMFRSQKDYARDTYSFETTPYMQVVAVFTGPFRPADIPEAQLKLHTGAFAGESEE